MDAEPQTPSAATLAGEACAACSELLARSAPYVALTDARTGWHAHYHAAEACVAGAFEVLAEVDRAHPEGGQVWILHHRTAHVGGN